MPVGGYCTECRKWVWVTPYGECENGHPATAVRDVQQLKPKPQAEVVFVEQPSAQGRSRFRWWWRHSLWMGWTFTAGFFNWLAFVYIGVRAKKASWTALGFVYLIPLVLTILAIGTPLLLPMIALQLVVSAASVANALYLRPQYRAIQFGDVPRQLPAAPQPPSRIGTVDRPPLPKGMDEAAAETLRAARAQVDHLLDSADSIEKPEVQDEVVALTRTADQILGELAARPRKLDAARGFLSYYLDAAQRIIDGYVYLNRRNTSSPEVEKTLARAEASLHVVQQAFDRELGAVLEDRVLDLDVEIELLEKTVHTQNMYSETGGL